MSNKLSQAEIDALVASLLAADAREAAQAGQDKSQGEGAKTDQSAAGETTAGGGAPGAAQPDDFASVTDLGMVTQEELDAAVAASKRAGAAPAGTASAATPSAPGTVAGAGTKTEAAGTAAGTAGTPTGAAGARPGSSGQGGAKAPRSLQSIAPGLRNALLDIELTLHVELGTVRLPLGEILAMGPGSVITLDRLASEPLDVKINQVPAMKAEVVAIGEKYGIRIVETKLRQDLAS